MQKIDGFLVRQSGGSRLNHARRMAPQVAVNVKNTFLELESSTREPVAAAGCCMHRANSRPSMCSRSVDESVSNEDLSACSRPQPSDKYSNARRSLILSKLPDRTDEHEEDTLSCCASSGPNSYWHGSDIPGSTYHSEFSENAPPDTRVGQAAATPRGRTPLSGKAKSFTPLGCKDKVFAPSCPQAAGALGRAPCSTGQESAPSVPQLAADKKQTTTLIMCNAPGGITSDELINVMNKQGVNGVDSSICFADREEITNRFIDCLNGSAQLLTATSCTAKACAAKWAEVQGLNVNIELHRDSTI